MAGEKVGGDGREGEEGGKVGAVGMTVGARQHSLSFMLKFIRFKLRVLLLSTWHVLLVGAVFLESVDFFLLFTATKNHKSYQDLKIL